jgi:hypothetical protein
MGIFCPPLRGAARILYGLQSGFQFAATIFRSTDCKKRDRSSAEEKRCCARQPAGARRVQRHRARRLLGGLPRCALSGNCLPGVHHNGGAHRPILTTSAPRKKLVSGLSRINASQCLIAGTSASSGSVSKYVSYAQACFHASGSHP